MVNKVVKIDTIHYRGTDDEDHVAHRGDKVAVHKDNVEHFDWVQGDTPDARWDELVKRDQESESPSFPEDEAKVEQAQAAFIPVVDDSPAPTAAKG